MKISKSSIDELKQILNKEGKPVDHEEAAKIGKWLIRIYSSLGKPK